METQYHIIKSFSYTRYDGEKTMFDQLYGTILINKCIPIIGYIGDRIDYRLLTRILYIDKDVCEHIKEHAPALIDSIKGKPAVIEEGTGIKEIFTGREINVDNVDNIIVKNRLVLSYLESDGSIIPNIMDEEPQIKFYDSDLLLLLKAFEFKSRKKELKEIEEHYNFKWDEGPITDSVVFEKDELKL